MSSPRDIHMPLPDGGRIPRVGKLRLGIKIERMRDDGSAFSYPSKVDYFVVNEDASTSRQSAESFHAVYGDEPRELDIVLPAPHTEDVLEGAYRQYGTGGKLKRKCTGPDGQCVTRDDAGDWNAGACWCEANNIPLEVKNKKGEMVKNPERCQLRYTLTVMLMRVAGVGCWQLDTGSVMAGEGLTASLRMLEQFRGHLQGAQATLRVVPKQVAPGGKATTVYIVELGSLDITPQQALAIASERAGRVSLPASSLDDEPDPLLDHEHRALEAGDVVEESASTPEPGAATPPGPPTTPVAPEAAQTGAPTIPKGGLKEALKALDADQLSTLYAECGIPKGTRLPDVETKLWLKWAALGLPDDQQGDPVPVTLLGAIYAYRARAAAFEHDVHAGHFAEDGEQAKLEDEALA